MELVKYRDAGMTTYTWFWVNEQRQMQSPFFDSEDQAQEWMRELLVSSIKTQVNIESKSLKEMK